MARDDEAGPEGAPVIGLQLLPVALSLIVLAAHFMRAGNAIMVVVILIVLGLLGVRRRWAARVIQLTLLLGAAEWARTLVRLVTWRAGAGEPVSRLVLILGSVALLTALSALVFRSERVRNRYEAGGGPGARGGRAAGGARFP